MKKIFNSSKRGIAVILTLCILIGIAGTCVHATVVDETTQVTDEPTQELQPAMARDCEPTVIYVNSSIKEKGNEPNATYIYCSGGGAGISKGVTYSIAQMNNLGQTIWRQDLNSYNGNPLHHGSIYGPHQHNFTWTSYTNTVGEIFWNFTEQVFGLS